MSVTLEKVNSRKYELDEQDVLAFRWLIDGYRFLMERREQKDRQEKEQQLESLFEKWKDALENGPEGSCSAFGDLLEALRKLMPRNVYLLMGYHGAIIFDGCDYGYAEFDNPELAAIKLERILDMTLRFEAPSVFEFQLPSLINLCERFPDLKAKLQQAIEQGLVEMVGTTYSHPYLTLQSNESNIRQLQYGVDLCRDAFGVKPKVYACSEHALHPQIPQLLKLLGIEGASLRSRLCGITPGTPFPVHYWRGLDGTEITALAHQSGRYSGEYYASAFYKEIFSLIFQATSGLGAVPYSVYNSLVDHTAELEDRLEEAYRVSRFGNFIGQHMTFQQLFEKGPAPEGVFQHSYDGFSMTYIPHEQGEGLGRRLMRSIYRLEECLLNYEAAISFDWLSGGSKTLDKEALETAWKACLLAQNHDSVAIPHYRSGQYHEERRHVIKIPEDLKLEAPSDYPTVGQYTLQLVEEQLEKYASFASPEPVVRQLSAGKVSIELNPEGKNRFSLSCQGKALSLHFEDSSGDYLKWEDRGPWKYESSCPKAGLQFGLVDSNLFLKLITKEDRIRMIIEGFESGKELYVNYPLGMELSHRCRIQTLDTLWLKGEMLIHSPCNYYYESDKVRTFLQNYLYERGEYEFLFDFSGDTSEALPLTCRNRLNPSRLAENQAFWPELSLLAQQGIRISAVIPQSDGSVILRILNTTGNEKKVEISLPDNWRCSGEYDLHGEMLHTASSNRLSIRLSPWKLANYRLERIGN